jgi:protein-tyrosine-phosphatase
MCYGSVLGIHPEVPSLMGSHYGLRISNIKKNYGISILILLDLLMFLKKELDGKLFTLKQFNGATKKDDINIPDPYRTGVENYNRILIIVEENVEKLVSKIIEVNKSN